MDDLAARFVDELRLRAYEDQYIDAKEEEDLLRVAADQGISADLAQAALSEVCEANGYALESRVRAEVKLLLDTFFEGDGQIDEKEFHDAVALCRKATGDKRSELQCKRLVCGLIDESRYK